MTGSLVPRPQAGELARVYQEYEPARLSGIWEKRPVQPPDVTPFLALSRYKLGVPDDPSQMYRFDAGSTSPDSIFPMPKIDQGNPEEDGYDAEMQFIDLVERERVQVIGRRRPEIQIHVAHRLGASGLRNPVTAALDSYLQATGIDWATGNLHPKSANANFVVLRAPVSREKVSLELGGQPHIVTPAAIVAAGLRLTLVESFLRLNAINLVANSGGQLGQIPDHDQQR